MSHSPKAIGILDLDNDAIIPGFRNFEGKKTNMNNAGNRNFCVKLPADLAMKFRDEGFYVKERLDQNGDVDYYYMAIKVNMDSQWPPCVTVYSKNGPKQYGPEEIAALDGANIVAGEVWFNPYMKAGGDHKTAYLDELTVAIKGSDEERRNKYMSYFQKDDPVDDEPMPWDV